MSSLTDAIGWSHKEFADKPEEAPPPAADSDAALAEAMKGATAAMAEAATEAATTGALEAVERDRVDARKQAFYDTIYVVAGADGSVSAEERVKLTAGLRGLLGDGFDETTVQESLETAHVFYDEHKLKGTAANIAETITDEAERYSLLSIASVVAWLNGGVGTKEGLALQGLAAAFEIPIHKLHEVMGEAARTLR